MNKPTESSKGELNAVRLRSMENVTGEVKATACVQWVRCYLEDDSKPFSEVEMIQPLDGLSHTYPPQPKPQPHQKAASNKTYPWRSTLTATGSKKVRMCISHIPWPVTANTWLVTPASLDNTNTSFVISSKTPNKSSQLCCNIGCKSVSPLELNKNVFRNMRETDQTVDSLGNVTSRRTEGNACW